MDIHNPIMDIHNSNMDIYNLIMDIHNSIMDIHNYNALVPTSLTTTVIVTSYLLASKLASDTCIYGYP